MVSSIRQRFTRVLSIAFAAAPVAFALIRALATGSDLRFVWLALASFVGVALVMRVGQARRRRAGAIVALAAIAFAVAASLAAATAWLLGARSATSVWFVSAGFAFCWAVSHALHMLSHPSTA